LRGIGIRHLTATQDGFFDAPDDGQMLVAERLVEDRFEVGFAEQAEVQATGFTSSRIGDGRNGAQSFAFAFRSRRYAFFCS
jgi:hypothetical protein